jgi:hypothetical protein
VKGVLSPAWPPSPEAFEHRFLSPVKVFPCEMVLSFASGTNGRINVRCRCMAGTHRKPSRRYFNYDALGTAADLREIRALWSQHCADRSDSRRTA